MGSKFFPALVEAIAQSLDVRWVFLSRPSEREPSKANTLAVWNDGPAANMSYDLAGSPCAEIIGDGACCYSSDVQRLFPDDVLLSEMGAESYVGIPLRASTGDVIGLIAALDDKTIDDSEVAREILAMFAGRAAAEIERLETASANERMGRIVEDSVSEAFVFDGDDYTFELVNRGARDNLGFSLKELRELTPWNIKPEYSETQFRDFVKPLKAGKVPYLEFETIHQRKDGSHYNVSVRLQYFGGTDNVFFASIYDITERKMAEERERLLMREVNHRAKNLLSIIQVIARQTVASRPESYIARFEDRIAALAASYDLLVENPKAGVRLRSLIRAQLGHFDHLFDKRISIDGPTVHLNAAAAQSVGMALHELATNGAKYGALSNDEGCVSIDWRLVDGQDDAQMLELTWVESGGPPVSTPDRKGFGSTVIDSAVRSTTRGHVALDYEPSGLTFKLTAPLSALSIKYRSAEDGGPAEDVQ
ncbi:HWE histidine kinase domain-containing protein [Sphingomicrobium marinum]|uniref:HWE histidine kinase domain-containing protein n=1 Tax=Sphingomicrobium marinum TaxID=1227950 RepID=UPI0022400D97|nr:HWE histidine kinase domain-containing protein [Sphingomicrobium marinum]